MKVKSLISQMEKQAKIPLRMGGDNPPRLSTGVFALDYALGGGIPMGRLTVVYGPPDAMKTTTVLRVIAQAQAAFPDKVAVFLDIEGHYTKEWAAHMGVDVDRLQVILPTHAEHAIEIVEKLLYAEDLSVLAIDSLAALVSANELHQDIDKNPVGMTGLMINKLYRRTSIALGEALRSGRNPVLVYINQIRYQVGAMMGSGEIMPGGPSYRFASSLTVRLYSKKVNDPNVVKELPVWQEGSAIIKKAKVPIRNPNAGWQMALRPVPDEGLDVGGVRNWRTALSLMKGSEMLSGDSKSGYELVRPDTGEISQHGTLKEIKSLFHDDPEFSKGILAGLLKA